MNEEEATAAAVRRTEHSGKAVYVPVQRAAGHWEVVQDKPEKVGVIRSLGRALRDGVYG